MPNKEVEKAKEALAIALDDLRGVCEIRIKGWKLELPERETSGLTRDEKDRVQREQETYTNAKLSIQVLRDTLAEIGRRQKIIDQCREVLNGLEQKLPHYEEQVQSSVREFEQAHYRIAEIMGHRKIANRCRRRERKSTMAKKTTTKKTETTETKEVESIEDLLSRLEKSDDAAEKRNIRAKLRRQGHYGGLNKPKAAPKKTAKKSTPKKTNKKSRKKTSKKTSKK